jgi:tetratricopeptide (TPR) repeat protein
MSITTSGAARLTQLTQLVLLCAGLASCAPLHVPSHELPQSIAIGRDLPASLPRDAGPDTAYLFVNLGQAYLRNGDLDAARIALERACLLDPLAAQSWQLLGDALGALGQDARAQQMWRQAAALRQHDLRADFAAAGGQTGVAALGQAMGASQPITDPGWARTEILVGVDGMMELRRTPASPVASQPSETRLDVARLEISNGNGVTGMARALARRIDEPGVQVTRLSNQPGFAVRHTRIEYEAAYFDAARRLAQRLGSAQLKEVERSAPANVRLVLGRDLARHGTALRLAPSGDQALAYR